MTPAPATFRRAVEARDLSSVLALLHPDVKFRSPVTHRVVVGAEPVGRLLGHVLEVFEDFRYVDELAGDGTHGLVFRARVGTRDVEGWDYLTTDAEGRITTFVVMVRPLSGLVALAEQMGARLAADVREST
jgi:hypothetical protein